MEDGFYGSFVSQVGFSLFEPRVRQYDTILVRTTVKRRWKRRWKRTDLQYHILCLMDEVHLRLAMGRYALLTFEASDTVTGTWNMESDAELRNRHCREQDAFYIPLNYHSGSIIKLLHRPCITGIIPRMSIPMR